MQQKRILIPLPTYGFDPTEVAIPWKVFSEKFEVVFMTPDGDRGTPDSLMLTGEKLGILKSVLMAREDAIETYDEMKKYKSFCSPIKYEDAHESDFEALYLPGGHDKKVKEYLESEVLQKLVVDFFVAEKPVGAICHGVVVAARSINPDTGKSVISNYKTTCLLKSQEQLAYNLTKLWLKDYYLTYPGLLVEDEVRAVLSDKNNFVKGTAPLFRDSPFQLNRGFSVRDRNYLSARWPGDAYNFSFAFVEMIEEAS
jgi:protease I